MKYCPTCETKYDEDILRFCMKDGTPLVDAEEPNFIQMPSESLAADEEDDPGEVTVVRRNKPAPVPVPPPPPPPADDITDFSASSPSGGQRIVVPTMHEQTRQNANPRAYAAPPQKPNTAKVVVATIFLTLAVLAIGAFGFWAIQRMTATDDANTNVNVNANFGNENTNVNTNLGLDANFDFNTNSNGDWNSNVNAATPTPTPSPTPKPSPSATPSPTPDDDDDDQDPTPTPAPSRTPIRTPTPLIIRPDTPRPPSNSNGGVLNGRALSLPKPVYPATARQMKAGGRVTVQVAVDDNGNIVSARAVSGHPLLRAAAENAARRAKMRDDAQGTSGQLVYNFQNN